MKNTRHNRHVFVATLLGMVMLGGCAKVRYPTNYMLTFPPHVAPGATPREALDALVIREFRCPEYISQGRIVYRPSAQEVGFYEYHRWAVEPSRAVTRLVGDTLRARSIFRNVATQERGVKAAYELTGNIERLEEVDRSRDVRAYCEITAQLADARTGSVIWTGTASETIPVEERNISGVVFSLSAATRITVERLVDSLASELARSGRL
jgi:ABC-type uncharacterized transport system auxiliary subunit